MHTSGTIKTHISDHFPIVFALNTCEKVSQKIRYNLFINGEYIYGEEQIELFKLDLGQIGWNNIIKTLDNPNTEYESFFNVFCETYDKYFPEVKTKIKAKTVQNL